MTTPTKEANATRDASKLIVEGPGHVAAAGLGGRWMSLTDLLFPPADRLPGATTALADQSTANAPGREPQAEQLQLWPADGVMDDPTGEDDLTALEQLLDVLRSDALHELYLLDGYTNVHATLDGSALRADLARLIAAAPAWARPRDEDEW